MEAVNKIITPAFLAALAKLKPEQVICGAPLHPRRLKEKFEVPEYAANYIHQDNHAKICICQEGVCALVLDGNSFLMKTGDVAFIGRNTEHYVSYLKKNQPYGLCWFLLRGWNRVDIHQSEYNRKGLFQVFNRHMIKVPLEAYRKVDQLVVDGRAAAGNWPAQKKNIVSLFTLFGAQKLVQLAPVDNKWQWRILADVADYLKKNFREDLTVANVAQKFSLSASYLDAQFKREHGEGMIHFLNAMRLREAANFLQHSTANINQSAAAGGFNDIYYFRRIFKKYFGLTPSEYRKHFC